MIGNFINGGLKGGKTGGKIKDFPNDEVICIKNSSHFCAKINGENPINTEIEEGRPKDGTLWNPG